MMGHRLALGPRTVPAASLIARDHYHGAVPLSRQPCRRADARPAPARASDQPPGSTGGGGDSGPRRSNLPAPVTPGGFLSLESLIQQAYALQTALPGQRGDWQEIEGSWVLYPPEGRRPEAVVHFIGGAFVGAAPQLTYRSLLEALASRGVLVITTPFSTGFDHLRAADEIQYKFDRVASVLAADIGGLPVYGVGHSLGSVLHSLICSRYAPERAGNALMAFNNRPATDTIPFLSPFIAPSARALAPLLSQLATPGPLRATVESATDALRGLSPSLVRQVMPMIDQLSPIFLDVSQGRQEFTPAPDETKSMVRNYYAVRRNLLLRFQDDSIDETLGLAVLLQSSSAVSSSLDLSVRTLPGDHIRPLQQVLGDLPPELTRAANQAVEQGSNILGRLAGLAQQAGIPTASSPLEDLQKGVSSLAGIINNQVGGPGAATPDWGCAWRLADRAQAVSSMFVRGGPAVVGPRVPAGLGAVLMKGGPGAESIQLLADEVAAWMGVGGVVTQGSKALPASVVVERGAATSG
ncbi:hypothetical protein MNEG_1607 [Monoraphidium neglectum]|uniref:Uncharacterized protein n=1 Tax=Monoraphidium neglectum TaxID=145388 RepID=A0A0D2K7Y7_9CHLO|nr:hypothetical protein MNEG_1607 [Monoraphidium neglectum]KIZ06343.1 hypothetical protein MNEG_1607 [Monoraphidium neglectum]|eukprot:XP_013905362.1 hypothetical protein MNEG_1607 [Monoraphidium neglectum]